MSIGRTFPEAVISVGDAAARVKAMRITCAECEAVAYFAHQTGKARKPPVAAQQNFQNKGWVVGSGPRKDFCPIHAQPAARKGHGMKEKSFAAAATAEPPPASTVEDRRLINMKLAEVYAEGGYASPWTDQRVADDLGVPRAWVTEIREGFYGPEGSNPLFDQFLAESAALQHMQGEIVEARKGVLDFIRKANDEAAKVRMRCDEFDSKIREVQALAKRVEREIGR